MTLSKLAQLANVSVAVVSKAFSGRDDVSDAMREHVFAVAKQHGCFRQFYHARYDKPVIAVIIPEAISKYYIHYIETLKKDIEELGCTMLLSISNFDTKMTEELVRYYAEYSKVDGIILVGSSESFSFDCATDLVTVITPKKSLPPVTVTFSLENGIAECAGRLLELGHRKIGYVGEELTSGKEDLLVKTLKASGLEIRDEWIYSSKERFEEAGKDGTRKIMDASGGEISAIIGAYGYITAGIIEELTDMGISIPDGVSVISMDNDPYPIHAALDVAAIPSGTDDICREAMKILQARIWESDTLSSGSLVIESTFYPGNTVAKKP